MSKKRNHKDDRDDIFANLSIVVASLQRIGTEPDFAIAISLPSSDDEGGKKSVSVFTNQGQKEAIRMFEKGIKKIEQRGQNGADL